MPTIPLTNRFHTTTEQVPTANLGSALANSNRATYNMSDIISTVNSAGTIGGSITTGQVAFGASSANSIEGSANITSNGTNLILADYIAHLGDLNTFFGFNSNDNFQVQTNGNVQIQSNENHVNLNHQGTEKIRTKAEGVTVTGQIDIAALNTAPGSAVATGTVGEIRWAADYVYLCTATDTWVRAALATW
tara:strand:- start:3240 stop:3812 length:573 start_codon:yes stop_codon:yes gene_type:complete